MGKIFAMTAAGALQHAYPALVGASPQRARRSWSLEEKLAIIAEVGSSGDPVAVVARRHDMNANHLFNWIDRARAGTLGRRSRTSDGEQQSSSSRQQRAEPEQDFVDVGVFTREEMAAAFSGECLLEVDLPGELRMRVPISDEPELLTRAVRTLRAA